MPLEVWMKLRMYMLLSCLAILPNPCGTARPRFDTSTDMGLVLVPADAEIDSVIFRLRATDQDADFPLVFDITATVTPIVRIENLPCTLYNKICQANVILTRRLVSGRLHDFAVRVKDSKGDSNSMQATISVTNATTQRDKIFPHLPAIIMVPEDAKPGKELDYVLVRSNQWSGKPVYIELWQPKELFTIRQRQTPAETRGVITLTGELDFETQSMYTLTMYATDPYTEPKKDTRNIAGFHLVVIVQDVQDVPPIFTLAPPLTKINNTVQPGDVILRVHAEDGDKGVPREVTYGLVSEGNPFTPFFNISESTGEIILARSLEELTQITHVGAPVVLSVVAEEIRRSTNEPPAQATVVELGLLLGEPGNSPPFFENDNYVAWMDENAEPGTVVTFTEHYSTKVRDEDIGKAGVFALKLYNNNGTFEISPAVAERTANFIITVRDNNLIDYELYKSLRFEIIAQEVGPATNLSATVPATIFIRDVNDNAPEFESSSYKVALSENIESGTRVIQVHATDKDTGSFGRIQYTRILGPGSESFAIDPNTGVITIAMGNAILDRELTPSLQLSVEARDDDGKGLRGIVPLVVDLLDVNDNAPIFEKEHYEFTLNEDTTNFTMAAIIKAFDADAESPNNQVRYELIHGNYENKFYLNEMTGELFLREPINKVRRTRQNPFQNFVARIRGGVAKVQKSFDDLFLSTTSAPNVAGPIENFTIDEHESEDVTVKTPIIRQKRETNEVTFTLTARAYDLGVPHLSGLTQISVTKGSVAGARIVSFVVPGENPNPEKTAETLAAITGGRVTVKDIRPYTIKDVRNGSTSDMPTLDGEKRSIVVARVEPNDGGTSFVDIDRIRAALAANGVGVIGGGMSMETGSTPKPNDSDTSNHNTNTITKTNITNVYNEEVTVYRAENRLLFWLLIILGLLMLSALIALIICCICPSCPFYMAPRKRRVHSSETLIARSDGRPKRHLHRKHARLLEASWPGRKEAWSADPMRRNWQFNRRNQKAGGLASLPGDVHIIDREHEILDKAGSFRFRNSQMPMYSTEQIRRPEEERICIEDMEGLRAREGYINVETLRQQDLERGLAMRHHPYVNHEDHTHEQTKFVREHEFYRDGNAEVLRLVTREQIDPRLIGHGARPHTLVIERGPPGAYHDDGKDILLQRFIEDQKHRLATGGQELHESLQDIERRSMDSHHRQRDVAVGLQAQQPQPKILIIPERLEDNRQHIEELGPEVQRLIIDHSSVEKTEKLEPEGSQDVLPGATLLVHAPAPKLTSETIIEQSLQQNANIQHYSIHDLELARQNALLTRLLLERDVREVGGGAMVDSASYLETQSLPGQVAIATQTDRTAATQTELPSRSRSDNDESEEEARMRKKMKCKKRHTDGEPRRIRTLWMKSPIHEEETHCGAEKKTSFSRKKMRDIKESRRICLESDVLKEISDSLDENGEMPSVLRRREDNTVSTSKEESQSKTESGQLEDSSSLESTQRDDRKILSERIKTRIAPKEDAKRKSYNRDKPENVVEPSFRILEKEMSSLSKKLSKLTGKKILKYINESETDSHDAVTETVKNVEKTDKPMEATSKRIKHAESTKAKNTKVVSRTMLPESSSTKHQAKKRDEIIDNKMHAPLKQKKGHTISTGSSDFEEAIEKLKKPRSLLVTHSEKQKQAKPLHTKLKRESRVEQKDVAKPTLLTVPHDTGEGLDSSDTPSRESIKSYKSDRDSMRKKRSSSGSVGGKSEQNDSSPNSDILKDKKVKRKERSVDRKNVVDKRDAKETEPSSSSPHSDAVNNKKMHTDKRSKLEKNSAVEISEEKSASAQTASSPSTDSMKKKEVPKNYGTAIDTVNVVPGNEKEKSKEAENGRGYERIKLTYQDEMPVADKQSKEIDNNSEKAHNETTILSSAQSTGNSSPTTAEILIEKGNLEIPHLISNIAHTIIEETGTDKSEVPEEKTAADSNIKERIGHSEQNRSPGLIEPIDKEQVDDFERKKDPDQIEPIITEQVGYSEHKKEPKDRDTIEPIINEQIDGSKQNIDSDANESTIPTIAKETLIDFLSHEMKDSVQALQGHYQTIRDNIEKVKDAVVGSTLIDNVLGTKEKPAGQETIHEEVASENIDKMNLKESRIAAEKTDIKDEQHDARESDREETFTDNFDSFSANDAKLSLDSQNVKNEIAYKTLHSESSEDPVPVDDSVSNMPKGDGNDTKAATTDDSIEDSKIAETIKKEEIQESFSVISHETQQHTDESSNVPHLKITRSHTPVAEQLIIKETHPEKTPDTPIQTLTTQIETNVEVEEPIEAVQRSKTVLKSPDRSQIEEKLSDDRAKGTLVVPPLKIQIVGDNTVSQDECNKQSDNSSRLPLSSPKEYGIADSLFVDAKELVEVKSPKTLVDEKNVDLENDVELKKEKTVVDDPPINLVEFSRGILDDHNDSDSSEASSKTMLAARPYGTPRHRPISGLKDPETVELASESVEMVPNGEKAITPIGSPEKLVKNVPSDLDKTYLIQITDLPMKTKTQTSPKKSEETMPAKRESEQTNVPIGLSSDPEKKPLEDTEKVKIGAQQQDPSGITSEKVVLYEIQQDRLAGDSDGFVSLPETDVPIKKSPDDAALATDAVLSEMKKGLPAEIVRNEMIENDIEPEEMHADDSVRTSDTAGLAEPSKKGLLKISRKVALTQQGINKVRDGKVPSKGDNRRIIKKTSSLPSRIGSPKKEQKIKIVKKDSPKVTKPSTVDERLRDSKRRTRPAETQLEDQITESSRGDQVRRTRRKINAADKDKNETEKLKLECEKSVSKQPHHTHLKQETQKSSQIKKNKGHDKKEKIERRTLAQLKNVHPVHESQHEKINEDDDSKVVEPMTTDTIKVAAAHSPEHSSITMGAIVETDQQHKPSLEFPKYPLDNKEFLEDTKSEAMTPDPMTSAEEAQHQEPTMHDNTVQLTGVRTLEKIDETSAFHDVVEDVINSTTTTEEKENKHTVKQPEEKLMKNETDVGLTKDSIEEKSLNISTSCDKMPSPRKSEKTRKEPEMVVIESQSRYMEWYKLKREEMERKRQDRKEGDEDEEKPKWLRKSTRQRWFKGGPDDRRVFDPKMAEIAQSGKRKIKPLKNVESEQLRAIVRQGRKLRKAQGEMSEDPKIQIFAPEKPPTPLISIPSTSQCHHHHHLVQHSEYKYEKMPPFYLHPPPAPNPSPQISPQHFEVLCPQQYTNLPSDSKCTSELYGSCKVQQQEQGGSKLRHGQLLEKKSVFDIAYNEAAPSQLRSDSATPPS